MDILFSARHVRKQYSNHLALDNVSIDIGRQRIFGLLGPNGAGKTTLIRIINQIIAPDSGELLFQGQPLKGMHVERIGYLPEERGLYKKMKVGEQALYLARLKGMPAHEAHRKLKYWFDKFEITAWWNRKVEELSKGMQQKVQFITTILHEPELLIFDEPFSGFDPINAQLLKEEILALRDKGSTIIFSTHNMASVEELCDDIALIHQGKKVLDGSVQEIRRSFAQQSFEVEMDLPFAGIRSILPQGFQMIEEKLSGSRLWARVQLPASAQANELLGALMPHGSIHRFNELIPGMNDIFIHHVRGRHTSDKLPEYAPFTE